MKTLKHWVLAAQDAAGVELRVDDQHLFACAYWSRAYSAC